MEGRGGGLNNFSLTSERGGLIREGALNRVFMVLYAR